MKDDDADLEVNWLLGSIYQNKRRIDNAEKQFNQVLLLQPEKKHELLQLYKAEVHDSFRRNELHLTVDLVSGILTHGQEYRHEAFDFFQKDFENRGENAELVIFARSKHQSFCIDQGLENTNATNRACSFHPESCSRNAQELPEGERLKLHSGLHHCQENVGFREYCPNR